MKYEYPELPEPIHTYEAHGGERMPAFSANQMREYSKQVVSTLLSEIEHLKDRVALYNHSHE